MWKICHGELWNLANWPAEFGKIYRGNLWSLAMGLQPTNSVKALKALL